jgi:L-lactate dehydrogenase complex protein LldE
MVRVFYPEILKDENTKEITAKFFELTEFSNERFYRLNQPKLNLITALPITILVTHLRELGIKDSPRVLLRNVKKIKLLEIEDGDRCCGFGGTFAVKFPEISTEMAKSKVDNIIKTGAEFVTSTDSSCLMHIGGYMAKNGVKVKTIHIAQILANF